MWRFALVPLVLAAGAAAGELVEGFAGDEDLAWLAAWSVMMCGIVALWPVYFGVREAHERRHAPPGDEPHER